MMLEKIKATNKLQYLLYVYVALIYHTVSDLIRGELKGVNPPQIFDQPILDGEDEDL